MKRFLPKEEFIYLDCKIRMSQKAMANLLYATIITESEIPCSHGIGIYEYSRSQNTFNSVDIKIHIHPDNIELFEKESGVKLKEPIKISIN